MLAPAGDSLLAYDELTFSRCKPGELVLLPGVLGRLNGLAGLADVLCTKYCGNAVLGDNFLPL